MMNCLSPLLFLRALPRPSRIKIFCHGGREERGGGKKDEGRRHEVVVSILFFYLYTLSPSLFFFLGVFASWRLRVLASSRLGVFASSSCATTQLAKRPSWRSKTLGGQKSLPTTQNHETRKHLPPMAAQYPPLRTNLLRYPRQCVYGCWGTGDYELCCRQSRAGWLCGLVGRRTTWQHCLWPRCPDHNPLRQLPPSGLAPVFAPTPTRGPSPNAVAIAPDRLLRQPKCRRATRLGRAATRSLRINGGD